MTSTPTDLRDLLAEATPGPWHRTRPGFDNYVSTIACRDGDGAFSHVIADICGRPPAEANAALIVAAVNALPGLLEEIDRLRVALDRYGRHAVWMPPAPR